MLLDVMCNTFGAIVLIALLLAIICQNTARALTKQHQKPDELAWAELEADNLRGELRKLQSKLERLSEVRALQTQLLTKLQSKGDGSQLPDLEDLAEKNRLLEKTFAQVRSKLQSYESVLRRATYFKARLIQCKNQIEELDSQIESLKQKRTEIVSKNTRTLRFPREHLISRKSCWVVLKNGRLLVTKYIESDGLSKRYNQDDFKVAEGAKETILTVISGRGEKISENPLKMSTMKKIFNSLSSQSYAIQFAVYPDSFDDLVGLRNAFLEKGYEYNWFPLQKGDPLTLVPAYSTTGQ